VEEEGCFQWVAGELAALSERANHAADSFVQFDGQALHPLNPVLGVLEVADDLASSKLRWNEHHKSVI
jgi:hypothetical protein